MNDKDANNANNAKKTSTADAKDVGALSLGQRAVRSAGWLLCAVPLVSLVELGLHVKQTTSDVVPDADFTAARDAIKGELRPDDLVTFAPKWIDPLGRRAFGGEIATLTREGRSDEARFARAFEIATRGAHDPTLERWKVVGTKHVGGITITTYENPAFTKVIDDLVDFVRPERLTVTKVDANGESPCAFQHGSSAGGSTVVPQGLLTPADKFVCAGGHVGVAVLHDLEHTGRLCIYATPVQNGTTRLRFKDVTFGPSLHGHGGVQWLVERTPTNEKISVSFSAFDRPIGTHVHKVGIGWIGFEFPTAEFVGKKGDLVADIGSTGATRPFCFEASTRQAPQSGGKGE